jgi:hypothetical protein
MNWENVYEPSVGLTRIMGIITSTVAVRMRAVTARH